MRPTAIAILALALPALARAQASQYLTESHWANPYVEHLIRRGVIRDPAPLTRPLRANAVLRALALADSLRTAGPDSAFVAELLRRLRTELDYDYRIDAWVGGEAGSEARRNQLRAAGDDYLVPQGGLRMTATTGPFAFISHPIFDNRLKHDPDYTGETDHGLIGRFTDALASAQFRYGELAIGNVARNWGPAGMPGLLISDENYSYDHIFAAAGGSNFRIELLTTRLDDFVRPSDGTVIHRYIAAHRAIVTPSDWLVVVLGQASLWDGPDAGYDLEWINPMKLTSLTQRDENDDNVNSAYNGQLWFRLPGSRTLQVEYLLDDFGWELGASAPARMGGTISFDTPVAGAAVRASATAVTTLAYRTQRGPVESFVRRGVGLGRNYSDYVEFDVRASVAPLPLFLLQPSLTVLLQGEGDIRDPFPELPANDTPLILDGIVERILRLGVAGEAALGTLDLAFEGGINLVGNAGHVDGASDARVTGRVGFRYRFGGGIRMGGTGLEPVTSGM